MARVLLGWELGLGFGHVEKLRPLAKALQEAGHSPILALKDLVGVSSVLQDCGYPILQAPVWPKTILEKSQASEPTFGSILHACGFSNEQALASVVSAWQV